MPISQPLYIVINKIKGSNNSLIANVNKKLISVLKKESDFYGWREYMEKRE